MNVFSREGAIGERLLKNGIRTCLRALNRIELEDSAVVTVIFVESTKRVELCELGWNRQTLVPYMGCKVFLLSEKENLNAY